MLDAGHDLYTAGKGVPSMKEFEFNRAVVTYMQELLKEYEGVIPHLSHDLFDGVDTPLSVRTDLANKWKVKAFISVHADAFSNATAKGETVFIYLKTGDSTLKLANAINDELKEDMSISNRGVKRADFHVLRETNMDAVLIEFGFMTNPEDLALLKSESYRLKCAQMIVNALVKFYGLKMKMAIEVVKGDKPVYTDKVTVPNTAYWQAAALVQEYQKRGFKCYALPSNPQVEQESNDPAPFVIETDFNHANIVKMELVNKGYGRAVWETI
jgi:N-acetylmuramoyl-L-alanine amidase